MAFLDNQYLLEDETAFALYSEVEELPVVDPHNHADVAQLAANVKFADPWQLFAATDHYVWEVMRKRGVEEKFITGDASAFEKWMALSRVFPEFIGNPVYEWVHLDLRTLGIHDVLLGPDTGEDVWEQAKAVLAVNSNKPQNLLDRMNVEVMCSTDDPTDTLEHHKTVNSAMGRKVVRPTWRPDKAVNIVNSAKFAEYVHALEKRFNMKITSVSELLNALQESHDFFAENDTVASDHALHHALSGEASPEDAEKAFLKALDGKTLTPNERDDYSSYVLNKVAEMDLKKNWVFQMHIGAVRDVRDSLYKNIGPDSGGDVSDHMLEIVNPLCRFLNHFDDKLKVVLYCLDAGHQASLATVSRAFGSKVRLGSAWWLNDTPIGMRRQLEYIGSVDLLYNFAGMVSDSRKLLSYSSRFEMFRRISANVIAEMVRLGQVPLTLAMNLMRHMSYSGPKEFYNL